MATLHCRHCGSEIDSDARRAQCRECRSLFPFACSVCERNLRSPFPVYEDERHLTLSEPPQPLCEEHFLRLCPDCKSWFGNEENPGYFRCLSCAEKAQNAPTHPEWSDVAEDGAPGESDLYGDYAEADQGRGVPVAARARAGFDSNTLVLGAAGCAFLALMGWLLTSR